MPIDAVMRATGLAGQSAIVGTINPSNRVSMGRDTEGKTLGEIEVTRKMIEAGMRAYTEFDDAFASIEEKFAAIFQAMWTARPDESPVRPPRPVTLRTAVLAAGARWARGLARR